MPKVIDKYVLQDKIGNGQFGEVFRGRHQDTLEVVAIKSIRRDMIKGKFYQLLQNQIKVLKTCDNPHIIKLYALKKTPHNYYLMLEYCNGGDMLAKVRKDGTVAEQQVIKYFCQILNAFQTLVKHKIMHRDFKLANILLHDDTIKIADFGFAKLLSNQDYTTTMLGSPLNMAPQVLGGNTYNNKADIWSIGACIFQMIYGKPPFVAGNMVDLAKLIKSKPLVLPSEPKICDELKDALKKMLIPDVKRRIEWSDLFNHPITHYFAKQRRHQAELELAEDQSLMLNSSKCYLRNNLVLTDPSQIKANCEVNDYLVDIIRTGKKQSQQSQATPQTKKTTHVKNSSKVNRHNSKRILHFRNIYAFLASVADQIINKTQFEHHEIAAYVVVRKILSMIQWLINIISGDECPLEGVQDWKNYSKQEQFIQIKGYITKQHKVFSVFNESLEPIIKKKSLQGIYQNDIKQLIAGPLKDQTYVKYMKIFLFQLAQTATAITINNRSLQNSKVDWKLLYYGLKIVNVDETFGVGEKEFDFKSFYDWFQILQEEKMLLDVEQMLTEVK